MFWILFSNSVSLFIPILDKVAMAIAPMIPPIIKPYFHPLVFPALYPDSNPSLLEMSFGWIGVI